MDRATAETLLIGRVKRPLIEAGISADPAADPSPRSYLDSPIWYAAHAVGATTAEDVPAEQELTFLDWLELATLQLVVNEINVVDVRTADMEHKYSQYADRLMKLIDAKKQALGVDEGDGGGGIVPAPSVGTFDRAIRDEGETGDDL